MKFKNLFNHLQFLVENSLARQENLSWAEIMEAISESAETVDSQTLILVCPLLLDALQNSPCEDREIAIRIIITYSRFIKARFPIFFYAVPDAQYLHLWNLEELPNFTPTFILKRALATNACSAEFDSILKSMQYSRPGSVPAWSRRFGTGGKLRDLALVALNTYDWKFLNVLVQYGFWNEEMYSQQIANNDESDFREFGQTCAYIGRRTGRFKELLKTIGLIWQCLRSSNGRMSCDNDRGFRRIPLIIRMLRITTLDLQLKSAYLQCLRIYVTALPDPLVSADEVQEFLLQFLKENRDDVDKYVNKYTEVFGRQPYAPRSLMHLSRCAARRTLIKNKSPALARLVEDLRIPRILKDFLLGSPLRAL